MKAARLASPREFEILDVPVPTPKDGEALVRMEHLSVCGSDLRTYDRVLKESDYPLDVGKPCHECLGTVVESRDPSIKEGQRVIALTYAGGLVEYAVVPANRLVAVPDSPDPSLWVLCQPSGTVLYACQQIGSVLGKRVVVLGQGPIGLVFSDMLARLGAVQVIATDLHDYRLEMAKRVGATHTINAAREDVAATVAEITHGEMADIAIEAVGRPLAAQQAFQVLRLHGLAVIFGLTHTEDVFPFDWAAMYAKLPHMMVVNSQQAGEVVPSVRTCVDLVAQGRLDFSYLVTHRLPFDQLATAYDLYSAKKDNSIKVIMSM